MPKRLLFMLVMILSLTATATAQGNGTSDQEAIRHVIEYYFNGWKNDDVESIKKAFHPKAKFFVAAIKDDLGLIGQSEVFAAFRSNIKRHVSKGKVDTRIISLDLAGNAASAKVEMHYPGDFQSATVTEYLSLIKFGNGWKIVSRVSSVANKPATVSQTKPRDAQF